MNVDATPQEKRAVKLLAAAAVSIERGEYEDEDLPKLLALINDARALLAEVSVEP